MGVGFPRRASAIRVDCSVYILYVTEVAGEEGLGMSGLRSVRSRVWRVAVYAWVVDMVLVCHPYDLPVCWEVAIRVVVFWVFCVGCAVYRA